LAAHGSFPDSAAAPRSSGVAVVASVAPLQRVELCLLRVKLLLLFVDDLLLLFDNAVQALS
jgi:hypothetical protein